MAEMEPSRGARIGSVVRRLRRAKQPPVTQRQLAALAVVAPGTIASLEAGRVRSPRSAMTDAIAAALGYGDTQIMLEADRVAREGPATRGASWADRRPPGPAPPGAALRLEVLTRDVESLKAAVQLLDQDHVELWRALFQHVADPPPARPAVPARSPTRAGGGWPRGVGGVADRPPVPYATGRAGSPEPAEPTTTAVRVADRAMEPWLAPGDLAVYDAGATPEPGDPVAVVLGPTADSATPPGSDTGRVLVRYYLPHGGEVELRPARGLSVVLPEEAVAVLGVVRHRLQAVPPLGEAETEASTAGRPRGRGPAHGRCT